MGGAAFAPPSTQAAPLAAHRTTRLRNTPRALRGNVSKLNASLRSFEDGRNAVLGVVCSPAGLPRQASETNGRKRAG